MYTPLRWAASVLVTSLLASCTPDKTVGVRVANRAPTIWLAAAPPEGSTGTYTVHLYWGGWDPDGEISHYEYLVTDNVTGVFNPADTTGAHWRPVQSNDSTFTFSADLLSDDAAISQRAVFTRSHTFFIRAVDEQGARSVAPAYRSFTARTLSPEVRITTPRAELGITPADIPPISTLSWVATDYVDDEMTKQEPDSVQWAMVSTTLHDNSYAQTLAYLRTPASAKEWHPWAWYRAPHDAGKSWTTPPLEFGDYVFAVRAKDEAGAITPVLHDPVNARRIKIAPRLSGPTFVVQNAFVGRVIASSCDFPLTIVDIAAGVDMSFSMSACADHYGGTVSGYRYGWDILDLNDPNQWEIDYTPFVGSIATTPPRRFSFGTHTFSAEVIDNSGFCSRIEVKTNIVRFNGVRNLLIVDDYRPDEVPGQSGWAATNGGVPSDSEHNAFWLDMVSNLDAFDGGRDMIATSIDREIPLTTIASYKNLFWSVFGDVNTTSVGDLPLLYSYIQYKSKRPSSSAQGACGAIPGGGGKVLPNAIALAMQAGVHVLIAGNHPIQNVVPRSSTFQVRWPMLPLYELEPGSTQTGSGPANVANPPGDQGFAYRNLCLDAIDFAWLSLQRARTSGTGSNRRYCPINGWRTPDNSTESRRDGTMRGAIPLDPAFPAISLRPEAAGPGRHFQESSQGVDAEVYNPAYFRQGAACSYVPAPRPCFQPIYGLVCRDTSEPTYQQPVAFWASAFAHVVADDIPGAVAARSVVFGFPPVYFNPHEIKPAFEHILFEEWQLPRRPITTTSLR